MVRRVVSLKKGKRLISFGRIYIITQRLNKASNNRKEDCCTANCNQIERSHLTFWSHSDAHECMDAFLSSVMSHTYVHYIEIHTDY